MDGRLPFAVDPAFPHAGNGDRGRGIPDSFLDLAYELTVTTASVAERRARLLSPYSKDHEASQVKRMELGVMPKTLTGLLRWFEEQWALETPVRLHVQAVWHDEVSPIEADHGVHPVGGSDTGAPAYSEPFRQSLENSPGQLDQDGYYQRPVAAAIARINRHGRPAMANALTAVAIAGFDWRVVADRGNWHHEMFADYIAEALIKLWREYRERGLVAA